MVNVDQKLDHWGKKRLTWTSLCTQLATRNRAARGGDFVLIESQSSQTYIPRLTLPRNLTPLLLVCNKCVYKCVKDPMFIVQNGVGRGRTSDHYAWKEKDCGKTIQDARRVV
ncbi:hypothetical protein BaRGS_00024842 [Batillaria attramentaria]|uniref:Uncharacterized protein n=1 Tax=Batillaria attramentaria TaxID=370345 RepID=A0ABD0KA26_9CAEN